jgi:hypothetical protein
VKKLQTFCEELDADLGGTEIEAALELGYKIAAKAPASDLFLITDGEVGVGAALPRRPAPKVIGSLQWESVTQWPKRSFAVWPAKRVVPANS